MRSARRPRRSFPLIRSMIVMVIARMIMPVMMVPVIIMMIMLAPLRLTLQVLSLSLPLLLLSSSSGAGCAGRDLLARLAGAHRVARPASRPCGVEPTRRISVARWKDRTNSTPAAIHSTADEARRANLTPLDAASQTPRRCCE